MDPASAGFFHVKCGKIMHGNLEPEGTVMNVSNRWEDGGTMDCVEELVQKLGWDPSDKISVELGGVQTYEIDGEGTKWAPGKGTVRYNKDAFIVIKNQSRRT